MARKAKDNDDEGQGHGSNIPDGKIVLDFITRYENLEDDVAKEREASRISVQAIRDDQDELLKEARKAGFRPKALRAHVKRRKLERDARAQADKLKDEADRLNYETQYLALEKLGPLGQAALQAALQAA